MLSVDGTVSTVTHEKLSHLIGQESKEQRDNDDDAVEKKPNNMCNMCLPTAGSDYVEKEIRLCRTKKECTCHLLIIPEQRNVEYTGRAIVRSGDEHIEVWR